ncbi:MAG: DUF2950 family protein [Roseobacter sp.]|jgi:hypothetical protein|nr:DUF2950 family protein [Roseobacter sp.]
MRITKVIALTASLFLAGPVFAQPASYATPQDALDAMIDALRASDRAAVLGVFGEDAEDYLSDGDPVEDKLNRLTLLALYQEGYRFEPQEDGAVMIALGAESWLFPVPIAKTEEGLWSFDNEAGREEVRLREIGVNELEILELLEAYVTIQSSYRQVDLDGDGVMEFAQQIISSTPEARDGLFWPDEDTLLGELFARASATGYNDGTSDQPPEPFFGYYFRILTKQSDAAPGGAMDYVINDNMVGGHALLAVPAVYGETGVHSFMVAENGVILEAVLGEDTLDLAAEMDAYDPNENWTIVED